MYRFKEQYRDVTIHIPSIRLKVTSENVNQWSELIYKEFPQHKDMLELVEDKVKGIAKVEEPKQSKPTKTED